MSREVCEHGRALWANCAECGTALVHRACLDVGNHNAIVSQLNAEIAALRAQLVRDENHAPCQAEIAALKAEVVELKKSGSIVRKFFEDESALKAEREAYRRVAIRYAIEAQIESGEGIDVKESFVAGIVDADAKALKGKK